MLRPIFAPTQLVRETMDDTLEDKILSLQARDSRYAKNAYMFVLEALDYTLSRQERERLGRDRHVGGRELLQGIRELAKDRFGAMAKEVFNQWGILSTEDFGEIVFNLVSAGMLQRRAQDSLKDFVNVYDFEREFEHGYRARRWEELSS